MYEQHWKLLFAICYSKTKDMGASEEIVQDVFVGLWKRGGELQVLKSLQSYLIKSVKVGIIKYFKKKAREASIIVEECDLCEHPEFVTGVLEHNEAITNFLEEDIEIIVGKLPCRCQEVYRMSREQHMTSREIAVKLGVSQKTVKNHLNKALATIRSRSTLLLNS